MQRLQAYKFELMPNGEQQRDMRGFSGACRFVFNKALALQKANYESKGAEVKLKVAAKPMATFKQRVRQLTRRSGGRSMGEVVQSLRPYMLGWTAYFGMAQTPGIWRTLDEWLRHRLRAIQLKHWKRGTTMFRELRAMGASFDVARQLAANSHRWWRNSAMLLNSVLTIAYFDRLGLPRLS